MFFMKSSQVWLRETVLSAFLHFIFFLVKSSPSKDADIENGLEDTGKGKGKLGLSERMAWTYIHYQR